MKWKLAGKLRVASMRGVLTGALRLRELQKQRKPKLSQKKRRLLARALAEVRQFLGAGVVSLFVQILRFREKPLQCGCAGDEALEHFTIHSVAYWA